VVPSPFFSAGGDLAAIAIRKSIADPMPDATRPDISRAKVDRAGRNVDERAGRDERACEIAESGDYPRR
jgi:hypothetical protein